MGEVRLITEPTVTLVGWPTFNREAVGEHLGEIGAAGGDFDPCSPDRATDAQILVETAGRTCYQSWGKGRPHADHVRHLVEVGHLSVLEHAQFTFMVAGVSRALSHELVRHRHHSPSQLSQRYVDQGGHALGFVVPPGLLGAHRLWVTQTARGLIAAPVQRGDEHGWRIGRWFHDSWAVPVRQSAEAYRALYEQLTADGMPRKSAREAARSVLPECAETRFVVSANLRAWLEYLPKRCSAAADAEHRRLACAFARLLRPEAPDVFAGLADRPLPDGTFELVPGGVP